MLSINMDDVMQVVSNIQNYLMHSASSSYSRSS